MTSSTKNTAAFAELSPEQRQALFDKLRQRKLTNARRPMADDLTPSSDTHLALSPVQVALLPQVTANSANRVLELTLRGPLTLEALRSAVADLDTRHSGLQVRFDTDQFLPVDQPLPLQANTISDDTAATLSQLRQQLAQDHSRGLQVGCLHQNDIVTHLLLA
ncbi:MAG TPA: hypothetical protein VM553_07035, partial [Dongiaceae bacterium]|nr:hypothetical protein [Dongiaceae bacterium]